MFRPPPQGGPQCPANLDLACYSDSDFATSDQLSRRSTTGYVFLSNGTAVHWQSKLQPVVTLSTAEAELQAVAAAVSNVLWIKKLYAESIKFSKSDSEPIKPIPKLTVFVDNQAAII